MAKQIAIVFLFLFLLGCSNENKEEELVFPEVDFTISAETTKIGEPVIFQARVFAGEENVEDADVRFEIWQDGQESDMDKATPAEHQGDGIYEIEKSFETPGTYFVYYHVDAMNMHLMEKSSFTITE